MPVYIKGYHRISGQTQVPSMRGKGFFDFLDPNKNGVANAFDPNKNGVANAFDPNKNGVAKYADNIGATNFVTKTLPSALIHNALPIAAEMIGSKFGVGNEARQLGEQGATELGNVSGMGFKKGSKEAKAHMAKLRSMRRK